MSKFVEGSINIKDQSCLVAALKKLFGENSVEVHEKPSNLYDYTGSEREQVAHIVVRQAAVNEVSGGPSNDIGFEKKTDGSYTFHVSEYDVKHEIRSKVQQKYAELLVTRTITRGTLQSRMSMFKMKNNKTGALTITLRRRGI